MEPVVYLPIELKHRELPSRLLIATHVLKAGYSVVIGNHWAMTNPANMAALPPGMFLFKTVNRLQGNIMAEARKHGHGIAASDEEVLVFTNRHGYMYAFSENAADACELFFAQSAGHKDAAEAQYPTLTGKIRVVGNPRIDLMSPTGRTLFEAHDERVEALRPYILFNTNYGSVNSVWGNNPERLLAIAAGTGMFDGPEKERKFAEFQAVMAWEQKNLEAMTALIKWTIANVRGVNIVLRPHPAERPEYWQAVIQGAANVHVIPRSDPHPWIMGAKLVVHTGCTTGLEALLLDKPVLNLLPANRPHSDQIVVDANPTARSPEEAAQAIAQYLRARTGPIVSHGDKAAQALATHLPSYRDDASARLIAAALAEELDRRGAAPKRNYALKWRGRYTPISRDPVQMDKYTATGIEMRRTLRKTAAVLGEDVKSRLGEIGEGLFVVTPA